MKLAALLTVLIAFVAAGCDVQSGITKKSVEKYAPTPTASKAPEVIVQIDPSDIVNADSTVDGPKLSIDKVTSKALDCTKYNRVGINIDQQEVTIKGVCKQLTLNGDRIRVEAVGVSEIVFNGANNTVKYSKYVNGKKPVIFDNGQGNLAEKIAVTETDK